MLEVSARRVTNLETGTPVNEDVAREAVEAFLIPQFDMTPDSDAWVRENFDLMFEIALDSWYTDPELWPKKRDWKSFNHWFDVELIEVAWDLVNQPTVQRAATGPRGSTGWKRGFR